jgi:hypothetical protein
MNNDFDRHHMAREFAKVVLGKTDWPAKRPCRLDADGTLICEANTYYEDECLDVVKSISKRCYALADAMIEEGDKPREAK